MPTLEIAALEIAWFAALADAAPRERACAGGPAPGGSRPPARIIDFPHRPSSAPRPARLVRRLLDWPFKSRAERTK